MASQQIANLYPCKKRVVGSSPTSSAKRPRRSMDRTVACGATDRGSNPLEGAGIQHL